jgi:hypothetical protein
MKRIKPRIRLGGFLVFAVMLSSLLGAGVVARADEQTTFQWVIVGQARALAADHSQLLVSGSGTFVLGNPQDVTTNAGLWQTLDSLGNATGSGTFQVTSLIKFDLAPGAVPNPSIRGGLAFLRISYSDESRGILVVSCQLPGTPPSVAEGISASKGFTNYWSGFTSPAFFQTVTAPET